MKANLENIHEIYNIFCQKNRMNADIINLFGHFHLSQTLRHLKMEKQQGISASLLIVLLCLFRICHESIGSFSSHQFYGLFQSGKNCFYRMYNRPTMDWRKLLLRMSVRFMAILRERKAEETNHPHCLILDDTTLEKTERNAWRRACAYLPHQVGLQPELEHHHFFRHQDVLRQMFRDVPDALEYRSDEQRKQAVS